MSNWKVIIEGVEDDIEVQQDVYGLAHRHGAVSYTVDKSDRSRAAVSFMSESDARDFQFVYENDKPAQASGFITEVRKPVSEACGRTHEMDEDSMAQDDFYEVPAETPAADADMICTSCDGAYYSEYTVDDMCPACGTETLVMMDDEMRPRAAASEFGPESEGWGDFALESNGKIRIKKEHFDQFILQVAEQVLGPADDSEADVQCTSCDGVFYSDEVVDDVCPNCGTSSLMFSEPSDPVRNRARAAERGPREW